MIEKIHTKSLGNEMSKPVKMIIGNHDPDFTADFKPIQYKEENSRSEIRSQEGTYSPLSILFFHNTLPEYRIGWFQELSKRVDCKFVFTNEDLNKNVYGFDIDYERSSDMTYTFLADENEGIRQLDDMLKDVKNYDFVELPPIDSFREVKCAAKIVKACKKNNVKLGYFWEKWEAPKEIQPITRRIRNLALRIIPKAIYKNVDIVFAVGKKSREYFISNGIDEKKITIIPDVSETPPCKYEDIRSKYGISVDKIIIMYLGRLMPQKGVQYLIRAFSMLESEIREKCHLLIAGDGEDRYMCERVAADLKISNITFAGAVEPRTRGNYFAQCNLFVYPVTYYVGRVDVWGLALNEAIQHGKIVITTDAVGSAYELIEDGVNGYRIEPENVQALQEALEKAVTTQMAQTVAAKDEKLMEVYNFRVMAESYIAAVKSII